MVRRPRLTPMSLVETELLNNEHTSVGSEQVRKRDLRVLRGRRPANCRAGLARCKHRVLPDLMQAAIAQALPPLGGHDALLCLSPRSAFVI